MESVNENAKTYTLRELTAEDMFPMLGIIDKIGAEKIFDCFSSPEIIAAAASGEKVEKIGVGVAMKIARIVISNVQSIKDDLYTLLSQVSGLPRSDIAKLPMNTFIHMVVDVVKQVNFKDFFPDVSK